MLGLIKNSKYLYSCPWFHSTEIGLASNLTVLNLLGTIYKNIYDLSGSVAKARNAFFGVISGGAHSPFLFPANYFPT